MKTKRASAPDTKSILDRMRRRYASRLSSGETVAVKSTAALFKGNDADPNKFTAIISNAALDRDMEVVLPEGGGFKDFDTSGAGFYNHDYDRPCFVPGPVKLVNGQLVGSGKFLDTPFAQDVRVFVEAMAEAGKSAGVSIGFVPLERRRPTSKDRERYGTEVENVITKWKLLEWSIAPVQANPEAFVTMVGKKIGETRAKRLGIIVAKAPAPKKKTPSLIVVAVGRAPRGGGRRAAIDKAVATEVARAKGLNTL